MAEEIEMKYIAKTKSTDGGKNNCDNGCGVEYSALADAFHTYMMARQERTGTKDGKLVLRIEE